MNLEDIIQSFHPKRVSTESGLQAALALLGPLTADAERRPGLMEEFLDLVLNASFSTLAPFVLFYLGLYIEDHGHLVDLIFPEKPNAFPTSTAHRLLCALRDFFFIAVPPLDTFRDASQIHARVSNAAILLEDLSKLQLSLLASSFVTTSPKSPTFDGEELSDTEDFGYHIKVKRQSQGREKSAVAKARRHMAARAIQINDKVFLNLGISVPATAADAETKSREILLEQKNILIRYIGLLRNEGVMPYVKSNHIRDRKPSIPAFPKEKRQVLVPTQHGLGAENTAPPTRPVTYQLKPARYYEEESLEPGHWPVLLSSRALKHIRTLAGRDATISGIVQKKIRELAQGHFSYSNQKILAGNASEVPIYEAKMTRDLRLVYQVDCGIGYRKLANGSESSYERQELKVYGIFTHAQIDKRLWALVASQSHRRSPEYRRRCIFREVARSQGVNVTPPAEFPSLTDEEREEKEGEYASGVACLDADYLELHEIVALERFMAYSQTLLETTLGNQEMAHVFNVSPKEEEIIYHSSSCLVIGRSGTGKTTTMLFKMIALERAAQQHGTKIRQIFVTQSRILARRVEDYFRKLVATSRPTSTGPGGGSPKQDQQVGSQSMEGLIGYDNEADDDERLPSRWSELQDHHFPLFLTFNQLCRLLERDCSLALYSEHPVEVGRTAQPKAMLLTFEQFLHHLWPHFDERLKKGLDPALVFGEFMGVIRGCEESLMTSKGYVDRSAYEDLRIRTHMPAHLRPRIYSLFEIYIKRKQLLRYHDAPERTHALLKALAKGIPGQPVDFLYVDEAQDNLIIDTGLLRLLCQSPHGLLFAGDTAQTIAVGSSFRFDALKAYLWRFETSDPSVRGGKRQAIHPALFQLSVNYRSHRGIVNTAASVVRLILDLFPQSIDDMKPERGIVNGPKPVFFTLDGGDARFEQFLRGNTNSPIEFGADQAILVRNAAARETIHAEIGSDVGMIFTLYESKGLEFNDVLLYNFFADSRSSAADWRVVLNCLAGQFKIAAPAFDDARHAGIQSELKFLYVGLTRARKRIWIWDSSSVGDAVKTFWEYKGLIDICGRNNPVPQLAAESSFEAWAERGRQLFANKRYPQSLLCFERAGMPLEMAITKAYISRENARTLLTRDATRSSAMVAAAAAFESAAALSAETPAQQRKLFQAAAECLVEAGQRVQAAKIYYKAEAFTDSAIQYRKANLFDEAIEVVQSHRSQMDPVVANEIMSVSRFYYAKTHQIQKAEELFDDVDDHVRFLEDYGLDEVRATVLESHDRFEEAGELQLLMGHEFEAIRLFLKSTSALTRQRAADSILDALFKRFFVGAPTQIQQDESTTRLINIGRPVLLGPEIAMFYALQGDDHDRLMQLGCQFAESGNNAYALVVYDRALREPPSIHDASVEELIQVLRHYRLYGDAMKELYWMTNVVETAAVQRILNFTPVVDTAGSGEPVHVHHCRIPQSSALFARATSLYSAVQDSHGNAIMPIRGVEIIIKTTISSRYNAALTALDDRLRPARALQPCIEHAATGVCPRGSCYKEHAPIDASKDFWLSKRVRAMALIIILLDNVYVEPGSAHLSGRPHIQRVWLSKLFQTIHPVMPMLGSVANVDIRFPEYPSFVPILKIWLQDRLNNLDPRSDTTYQHFLGDVISMSLLAYTLDHAHATHYVTRTPWATMHLPLLLDPKSNRTVVEEALEWFTGKEKYSLLMGVLFVRKISQNPTFYMDINSFTAYIENIVSHVVVNRSFSSAFHGDAALHRITLPRTWAVAVLARPSPYDNSQRAFLLLDAVDGLLRTLLNPALDRQFFFNRKPLWEYHHTFRRYFVARLCQALVILGYNHGPALQSQIVNFFIRLPQQTQFRHQLFLPYMNPRFWADLRNAMRKSTLNCPNNELCTFMHISQPIPSTSPSGIRFVSYTTKLDLLKQIGCLGNLIPPILTPGSEDEEGVDAVRKEDGPEATNGSDQTVVGPEDRQGQGEHAEEIAQEDLISVDRPSDAPLHGLVKVEGEVENGSNEDEPERAIFGVARTPEEDAAARCIQKHWKRARREASKSGNHFYMECVRMLAQWGPGKPPQQDYKLFYLGPLPHILLYLERVERSFSGKKKKIQKRLKEKDDPEESLMNRITELASLEKQVRSLRHTVRPGAELHQACSVMNLKLAVRGIETLKVEIDRLLPGQHESTTLEYNLGWKGLLKVAEKRQKPNPRRPTLNTEDLEF
ncbi:hypothetical protein FRB93_008909 [Tulasnella sp. JGI-2019a]|nr:hypothetical protein FRB93_008909 [Tulasnella sp. JGI-2019a]